MAVIFWRKGVRNDLVFKRIIFEKLTGEAAMISLIHLLNLKALYQNILGLFFPT